MNAQKLVCGIFFQILQLTYEKHFKNWQDIASSEL